MTRFTSDAFTALQRFGLGPRGDRRNPAEIGGDPRGALLADLQFARQLPDVADLTPSPLLLEQVYEFRRQRRAANQRRAPAMDPGKAMEMAPAARPSPALKNQIGRASCRERGEISEVAGVVKKKRGRQHTQT